MRLSARAARTGVQDYGTHRELRPASEVFAPASLATWIGVPVTDGHPSSGTTDSNVEALAIGYVVAARRDGEFVAVDIVLFDADAAARVRSGHLVEFSAGYSVDLEKAAGQTTDGETYDGVQRNIRLNHLAMGPARWARCGTACSVTA